MLWFIDLGLGLSLGLGLRLGLCLGLNLGLRYEVRLVGANPYTDLSGCHEIQQTSSF